MSKTETALTSHNEAVARVRRAQARLAAGLRFRSGINLHRRDAPNSDLIELKPTRRRSGQPAAGDSTMETNMPFDTAEAIASEHLCIGTLRQRNLNALDFHDCGVVSILNALQAAYEAGRANGKASASNTLTAELKALLRECVTEGGSRRAPSLAAVDRAQRTVRNGI